MCQPYTGALELTNRHNGSLRLASDRTNLVKSPASVSYYLDFYYFAYSDLISLRLKHCTSTLDAPRSIATIIHRVQKELIREIHQSRDNGWLLFKQDHIKCWNVESYSYPDVHRFGFLLSLRGHVIGSLRAPCPSASVLCSTHYCFHFCLYLISLLIPISLVYIY